MPTYTYKCTECGHEFNLFHGISENGTRECTVCHAEAHRLIGAGAGLIFKGSGFYETDYKRKSNGHGNNGTSNGTSVTTSTNGSSATESSESTKKPGASKSVETAKSD